MNARVGIAALAGAVTLLTVARTCSAQGVTKQACIASSEKAQRLRDDGKLLRAREELLVCSQGECPGIVRQDCTQWMNEVIAALPSVVIGARDWRGHDLLAVTVWVDGKVVTDKLDGKPIAVDPGVHKIKYTSEGAPLPVEEDVLVREGEKNRSLTVTFPAPPGAVAPPALPPGADGDVGREVLPPPPRSAQGPSPLAWVFGGLGVATLGGALAVDLVGTSNAHTLRTSCAPNCSPSAVDEVRTEYAIADVLLGVGIVSAGFATYFAFASGEPSKEQKQTRVDFTVSPSPAGGLAARVVGSF